MTVYTVVGSRRKTEYELDPGDECPVCLSGTLGEETDGELVCRGECGNIFVQPRAFYQTEYRITVLSEGPMEDPITLDRIAYEIEEGHCLGRVEIITAEEISAQRCAHQCAWMGGDSDFFELDEEGNTIAV